jgi:hypothetical protein
MIQAVDLDPSSFRWEEVKVERGYLASKLVHIPSQYFFIFDYYQDSHWSVFSPGKDQPIEKELSPNWHVCRNKCVALWLAALKREVDSPDLWENLLGAKALIGVADTQSENSLFSLEEQAQLRTALTEMKSYILTVHKSSAVNQERLEQRLDYLAEASARLGRVDWRNAFAGALVGYFLEVAFTSQQIKDVSAFAWSLMKSVLGHLVEVAQIAM